MRGYNIDSELFSARDRKLNNKRKLKAHRSNDQRVQDSRPRFQRQDKWAQMQSFE